MKRRIIQIDTEKCNGCGACAAACHEGAIAMVDGKARLMRDDYCDGLGDCLPTCPTGAITFVEREAAPYDEAAVLAAKQRKAQAGGGCPGSAARTISAGCPGSRAQTLAGGMEAPAVPTMAPSRLRQWPVEIQLVPVAAPYFEGCDLLVAADCTAFAYGAFHEKLLKGRILLVGCPKLDHVNYAEKLTEIFARNDIRSITVARMEVPCCGGLEFAVKTALERSGRQIPLEVVTISTDGKILN